MAMHDFGIISEAITDSDDFQSYEPEKYGCIKIDDDYIENLIPLFLEIPTFFHHLSQKETGLDYFGITLIPPKSCKSFAEVFKAQKSSVYSELVELLEKAAKENRFVIHYGL